MAGTIARNVTGPYISPAFQIPSRHSLALLVAGSVFSATLECTLDPDSTDWVQIGPTFTTPSLYNFPVGPVKFRINLASGTLLSAQYNNSLVEQQQTNSTYSGPDYSASIGQAVTNAALALQGTQQTQQAISYLNKAALSADSALPNALRAYTDNSFWSWSATGTLGADTISGANGGFRIRENIGLLSNSRRAAPLGPVSVVEESSTAVSSPSFNTVAVPFGLGAAAAGRTFTNVPGARIQVNAVTDLSQLAGYGFDIVGDYVSVDANPALYGVSVGTGTFSGTTVTVPSPLSALAVPGAFFRTTHPQKWYAPIVSVSADRLSATVLAWYNGLTGATGSPANGTGAAVTLNPLDKVFGRNLLVGIGASSPTRIGVGEELDLYIAGGDVSAPAYDAIILGDGSSSQRGAFQARHVPGAGRWKYGHSSLGAAYDTSFASVPNPDDPTGVAPQFDNRAEHGTAGGYRSQGDRPHALWYSGNGTEVFFVDADGSLRLKGSAFGRAAARTATVPSSTAQTASATYVQAELQAVMTRLGQVVARLADVEAKAVAAGLMV